MKVTASRISLGYDEDLAKDLGKKLIFVLDKDVTFTVDGVTRIIPKGFVTDLASVPRIFWSIFPPYGLYLRAAVVHDYLYANQIGDRKWADDVFYALMEAYEVEGWRRNLMYAAVRVGGFAAWNDTNPVDNIAKQLQEEHLAAQGRA